MSELRCCSLCDQVCDDFSLCGVKVIDGKEYNYAICQRCVNEIPSPYLNGYQQAGAGRSDVWSALWEKLNSKHKA